MENKLIAHNKMVQKNEKECEEILENRRYLERMIKNALLEKTKELGAEWSEVEVCNNGVIEINFYKKISRKGYGVLYLHNEYDEKVCNVSFNDDFTKIKPCGIELETVDEIIETVKGVALWR